MKRKNDKVEKILKASIPWSSYKPLKEFETYKEKSLLILNIVANEVGIEWLSVSEIAQIISYRTRRKTTPQAVRISLNPQIGTLCEIRTNGENTTEYKSLKKSVDLLGLEVVSVNEEFSTKQIILPKDLFDNSKNYIQKVVFQINGCYRDGYYDACSVMLRRLFETVIIEIYENKGLEKSIKNEGGEYLKLGKLIKHIINNSQINLSSNSKQQLPKIKLFGDTGAHSRRVNLRKHDIDLYRDEIRLSAEDLVSIQNG